MAETIRVFVGCAPNNEDLESQAVYEWSMRKRASMPVEINWMQLSADPNSVWYSNPISRRGWNTGQWATPFTAFRWAVPYVCEFKGKAIYTDSDQIVMADIVELWNQEFKKGAPVISKGTNNPRYCVALFDCAAMRTFYSKPFEAFRQSPVLWNMVRRTVMPRTQQFQGNWNCLDGENYTSIHDPDIKILHYTSIPHQLQQKYAIPRLQAEGSKHWFPGKIQPHWKPGLQELFDELLAEAIANGYSPEKYRKEPYGEFNTRWKAA